MNTLDIYPPDWIWILPKHKSLEVELLGQRQWESLRPTGKREKNKDIMWTNLTHTFPPQQMRPQVQAQKEDREWGDLQRAQGWPGEGRGVQGQSRRGALTCGYVTPGKGFNHKKVPRTL